MAKKSKKNLITLECSKCHERNYHTTKSSGVTDRLALKKYCPRCRKPFIHQESK